MIRTQISGANGGGSSCLSNIGCLLSTAFFMIVGFFVMKWLVIGLYVISPLLFIAALLVNSKVVMGSLTQHFGLFRQEPGRFVLRSILGILFFPFIALFLLFLALGIKQVQRFQSNFSQQMDTIFHDGEKKGSHFDQDPFTKKTKQTATTDDDFVEYEEIESHPLGEEIPPTPPKAEKKPENPYEDLFEDE